MNRSYLEIYGGGGVYFVLCEGHAPRKAQMPSRSVNPCVGLGVGLRAKEILNLRHGSYNWAREEAAG